MVHVSPDRLNAILTKTRGKRIAVLGDVMLDRYFWGAVHRISPEAPVPVVDVEHESYHLGGAANVAANILSLGAHPILFGVVGNDASGAMVQSIASTDGLDASGVIAVESRPTTVKTRVIGNNQQLLRLDREVRTVIDDSVISEVVYRLSNEDNLAAIVFEDYNKGFLSDRMISVVIEYAKQRNVPVFVDPKREALRAYHGCFLFKPNRKEASDLLGRALESAEDIVMAGRELQQVLACSHVLITLGSQGMMLFEEGGIVSSVPTKARSVADVSGAGDTAIATLAVCVAGGATVREAASLANAASGAVVGEPGIVCITPAMLNEAVLDDERALAGGE